MEGDTNCEKVKPFFDIEEKLTMKVEIAASPLKIEMVNLTTLFFERNCGSQ